MMTAAATRRRLDMGISRNGTQRVALLMGLVVAALVIAAGNARALSGPEVLAAFGAISDSNGGNTLTTHDQGGLALAGRITFTPGGGASAVNITLGYTDNDCCTLFPAHDGITCSLTTPSDVAYTLTNGVGTLTLTVAATDTCVQTVAGTSVANTGKKIAFNMYKAAGAIALSATSMDLIDGAGHTIGSLAVSGSLSTGGSGAISAAPRVLQAQGAAADTDDDLGGLALAGRVKLDATGGAESLDITLGWAEQFETDGITCHLTTPGDLAYIFTSGVGTLTLTVAAGDTCIETVSGSASPSNTGRKITFNLYKSGNQVVLGGTSINFLDASHNTIDSLAISGSLR